MAVANKTGQGKVYLIGAGPGNPGLISVRGKELLDICDALVYDNLIPDELVVTAPRQTEKYFVGKSAGDHILSQDDICRLLVKLSREGKCVGRLKGSDPLIFGRGGEEARYLRDNGIEFEIVPGITAAVGAAAYAGIPCTDRKTASFVTFITGHRAEDSGYPAIPWEWVAKARNGTLALYMGVGEIEKIVHRLIGGGMDGKTPSAVIERGTFSTQRVFTTPLNSLAEKVKSEHIRPPAVFIIGETVNLRPHMQWLEGKPLAGIRIMVTRAADQAQEMYKSLRELGADVLPYPTIATEETVIPEAWQDIMAMADQHGWLIFTSENGVRYFFRQFLSRWKDIRHLSGVRIAAVGVGTASALARLHIAPDFIPSIATTASLASELKESGQTKGTPVLRVRGNLGDDRIEKTLTDAGAFVQPVRVYRTFFPEWPPGFRDKLFQYPPDLIAFTSGSTFDGLCHILGEDGVKEFTIGKIIASIGPSTSDHIRDRGIHTSLEADVHSIPGLIEKIIEHYAK
jgi:uroporphyrinogen III methyltransferase/synthase